MTIEILGNSNLAAVIKAATFFYYRKITPLGKKHLVFNMKIYIRVVQKGLYQPAMWTAYPVKN